MLFLEGVCLKNYFALNFSEYEVSPRNLLTRQIPQPVPKGCFK